MNLLHPAWRRRFGLAALAMVIASGTVTVVRGLIAPEDQFQYKIVAVTQTAPGQKPAVTFSVVDPTRGNVAYDILSDPAFRAPAGASRLFVQIGWDTRDYTNEGSGSEAAPSGAGPALPIAIDALAPGRATPNGDGTFTVTSPRAIPGFVTGSGVAVIEGHPAVDLDGDPLGVREFRVPVKSVYQPFPITDAAAVARRSVVDINKCKRCHTPHLSLHGNNRTDEIQVCVVCHNPNATDIPFRTAGDEVPIDFKFMVHAIHAGEMRENAFSVTGRNGAVADFSHVRFPAKLRNCLNCHTGSSFELPLSKGVQATTIDTGSVYGSPKLVDGNPANDLNITPTAAVCSSCHDRDSDRAHMIKGGASWQATQAQIDSGAVVERCASCHGPGKKVDVRLKHLDEDDGR